MTKLILLVEDNASDEKLALLAFRRCGVPCEIIVARDGADALDFLFLTGKYHDRDPMLRPALILLDLKLPRLDGLDVLKAIRAHDRTRYLPVVMLTSSDHDRDRLAAYHHHVNGYVKKPVDYDQFVEAARQLGLYWVVFNLAAPIPP